MTGDMEILARLDEALKVEDALKRGGNLPPGEAGYLPLLRDARAEIQRLSEERYADSYDKRHLPGCNKVMYDRKSSPCTCVTEWERACGEIRMAEANAEAWHRVVETICTVVGVSPALSAEESVIAVRAAFDQQQMNLRAVAEHGSAAVIATLTEELDSAQAACLEWDQIAKRLRREQEQLRADYDRLAGATARDIKALTEERDRLTAQLAEKERALREWLETRHEYARDYMLSARGVETPCDRCSGTGSYLYPSTSLWRGGLGGSAMRWGPCDRCWGSGDAQRLWISHREKEQELNHAAYVSDKRAAERDTAEASLTACREELARLREGGAQLVAQWEMYTRGGLSSEVFEKALRRVLSPKETPDA